MRKPPHTKKSAANKHPTAKINDAAQAYRLEKASMCADDNEKQNSRETNPTSAINPAGWLAMATTANNESGIRHSHRASFISVYW
jgi:hypothetical protein